MGRRKDAIKISEGDPCPKCGQPMSRYRHGDHWKPKEFQPYWFGWWDKCASCRHIQHYERAKRFAAVAV